MNIHRTIILHDLIAQRAKAHATIVQLTKDAASEPDPHYRACFASMLRLHIDGMPRLDAQIAEYQQE